MDALEKLKYLAPPTCFEPAEEVSRSRNIPTPRHADDLSGCVHRAVLPNGKRISLLKTLLSSICERDCRYCTFRQGHDFRRVSFSPDELARLFMQLHRKSLVEGAFLSSAITGSGPRTQDRLIATAELLRRRYEFQGYIHLKIMPGAEQAQILAAMRLADRVSINLEAPNNERLTQLAPHKIFTEELLQRLQWIEEIRRAIPGKWPSSTTQFVVGAVDETDAEILTTTEVLHQQYGLARAYFSGFAPVPGTPLENRPPSSPQREHRLYQASFLLRDYGFRATELPLDEAGNLPLTHDPKLIWALRHLADLPIELNTADRSELLRVPGIGPKSANVIMRERQRGKLRDLNDLRKLGIRIRRAVPFVLLDGSRPPRQLSLWAV